MYAIEEGEFAENTLPANDSLSTLTIVVSQLKLSDSFSGSLAPLDGTVEKVARSNAAAHVIM